MTFKLVYQMPKIGFLCTLVLWSFFEVRESTFISHFALARCIQ